MTLKSLYWIQGDEPYGVQQAVLSLWQKAKALNFCKRFYDAELAFDWQILSALKQTHDLFEPLVFVHLQWNHPKLDEQKLDILKALLALENPHYCVVITSLRLTATLQKQAFFKGLEKKGLLSTVWPLKPYEWPKWLKEEATLQNITLSAGAIQQLQKYHEGNPLSAKQAICRLSFLQKPLITDEDVQNDAEQGAQYGVFALIDTLLKQEPKALLMNAVLKQQGQELLPMLGAWMKSLDTLLKLHEQGAKESTLAEYCSRLGVFSKQVPLITSFFKKNNQTQLQHWWQKGVEVDTLIKRFETTLAWQRWEQCLGEICTAF